MKLTSTLFFFGLIINSITYSQINELKEAQDKRIEQINPAKKPDYFSKSLFVNPFIGTGGHGHTYPGASAPFGMIQLSPDTRHDGWDGCSGYHYSDSIIYGFSHTHLSGTGVPDYCDLLIVPQSGKPKIDPGYTSEKGFGSKFSHENEEASPGYYKVHLDDNDIDVELTVSQRAGFHHYTFNEETGKKFILIDLDHRDRLIASDIKTIDKQTIEGYRISEAWATNQQFYFHLKTDIPYQKAKYFTKKGRNKLLLTFPKSTKEVNIRVGISAVDCAGAKKNLEKEIPDWNFKSTRANVVKKWNNELDKISFKSFDKEIMTNFYTALYHSFLAPNIFNDVDGRYRGRDNEIHQLQSGEGDNYTVFSLWDTYRATHPLFTLTQEKRTNDFVKTFLRQFKQGGDLPVWELAANETECMIGYHSVSVIADAYVKGIRDFDEHAAIEAMLKTSHFDEFGKKEFQSNGFISCGDEPESVSKALEYAYDDFCIAQMLDAVNGETYGIYLGPQEEYRKSSMNFINSFDPSTKFMRGRRSGQWFSPFDPSEVNFNYTEANSWQYSLYAPHAVGVLTDLIGGKDSLESWLDRLFTTEMELSGRHQVDITGLIGQYAHGNEPSHHMAYLYNYTNSPEKTQFYIDRILKEMYSNQPDGLSGNEDCGQMSSWYVLSALGLYQIAPGNPFYEVGRPLITEGAIEFEGGNLLEIRSINNSPKNKYVQRVLLNGTELKRNFIIHEELKAGGKLVFEMGSKPNSNRAKYDHAPTISEVHESFIAAPFFTNTDRIFEDSVSIEISSNFPYNIEYRYTIDGTQPTTTSPLYEKPFTVSKTTTVKVIATKGDYASSVVSGDFVKKDESIQIHLESEYANQYASTGDFALIDGVVGSEEYRTGDWQGYWDQDFHAQLAFETPRTLNSITIGVLSDMKSWIFLPESMEIQVSYDGINFEDPITFKFDQQTEKDMPPKRNEAIFKLDGSKKVQSIIVTAKRTKECPEWHLGAGNPTWLFFDEISFN